MNRIGGLNVMIFNGYCKSSKTVRHKL